MFAPGKICLCYLCRVGTAACDMIACKWPFFFSCIFLKQTGLFSVVDRLLDLVVMSLIQSVDWAPSPLLSLLVFFYWNLEQKAVLVVSLLPYQMWLVPQSSTEMGKLLPWIILFSFFCWQSALCDGRLSCPIERIMLLQLKNSLRSGWA